MNYGPACSVSAVEALSGVAIDHFIEMNFEGFTKIVDAMDGLPVCLTEPLKDPLADLELPAGKQTVDGVDALALARTRHAVGDGSDIARMGHQQMVMSSIVQRVQSTEVLTRPDRPYGFLDAVTSSLTVDPDLESLSALASLASTVSGVSSDQITFMVMPWQAAPTDSNRVVPDTKAESVFGRIQKDQPIDGSKTTDDGPTSESRLPAPPDSPVAIVNASTIEGKAAEVQQAIEDLGFSVTNPTTAAQTQSATTVHADSSKKSQKTAEELVNRLGLNIDPTEGLVEGVVVTLGLDIEDVGVNLVEVTNAHENSNRSDAEVHSADQAMCNN